MHIRRLTVSIAGAALVMGVAAATAWAADSCQQEARAEFQDCKIGCKDTFTTAKDSCFNKQLLCVEACQAGREDCIEATGLPAALAACDQQTQQAVQKCKTSPEPETCEDQAQLVGFQCRQAARKNPAVKQCVKSFRGCITACPPSTGQAQNPTACRRAAQSAYLSCQGDCRTTFNVERGVCAGKSPVCVAACGVTRESCVTTVEDQLTAAIAACDATRDQEVAQCKVLYPPGSSALAQCIENAQAQAFLCRDAAREQAQPQSHACEQSFVSCVQACPPSSPSGAFLDLS
jgi:hypothetical protein